MAQNLTTRQNRGRDLATRGQPYHPLDLFRREMDTLFGRFFGGGLTPFEEDFGPTRGWGFDVDENDKEMVVRAEVPGFDENELDVRLENNVLTVKAEKEQKDGDQREYRSFFRQVALPPGIDAEKVQADYRSGVLELHIPRSEGSQPKRIPVRGQQALDSNSGANGGNGAQQDEKTASQKAKK